MRVITGRIGTALAILATIVVAAGPAIAGPPHPSAADWAQDGHDATHDAFNPDEYRITAGTVQRLVPRWTVVTGPGSARQQAPLVTGSRLFLADSAGVGAHDAATGTEQWRFALPETAGRRPPLLATDGQTLLAYLRSGESPGPMTGELVALDPASGAVRWRQAVPSGAPDGRLLLDHGVAVAGGNDGVTVGAWAFDAATGKPVWQRAGLDPQWPVADGKLLLTRPGNGGTTTVVIATGRIAWRTDKDWFGYAADPTSRFFLVGEENDLLKVRADTGFVVWRRAGLWGLPAIDHDRVYTGVADSPESLAAVDLTTGDMLWRNDVGFLPSVAGGLVWISHSTADEGWKLEAVDPLTGSVLGLPAAVHDAGGTDRVVVSHGWLYVTDGETLRAFTTA